MWFFTRAGQVLTKAVTTVASGVGLSSPLLYAWFGSGGPTNAGETVSVNTAMQLDVVFAAVTLKARTTATLPCHFYKKDPDGRGIAAKDHPLYRILHDQPNADMTAVVFWQVMVACLDLWGNAYAMISRTDLGRIVALTPLLPEYLQRLPMLPDGIVRYRYVYRGQNIPLTEYEVFHLKGFTLDGRVGISPISLARETLGLAMAAEKSAASTFRNGMRPSMAFKSPTYLNPDQQKTWEEVTKPALTGALNAGAVPLLQGGWGVENLSMKPDDAQLLSSRAFSVEQICRWFGVAPPMIGHMEKSTAWGTGLEQMNLWFLTYTLRPILEGIEQEISRSLLSPTERLLFYAEFNVEGLLRADSKGRAEVMQILANTGLRTRDELRALDNMPPAPGGDKLTVLSTYTPLDKLGEAPPTPPAPDPTAIPPKPPGT